jgi:chemotaxis protein methyltransferase CheR
MSAPTLAARTFDMAAGPPSPQLVRIRDLIYQVAGIFQPDNKLRMLEERCVKRMQAVGATGLHDYYECLTTRPIRQVELVNLLNEITVGETCFFRNQPQLDAVRHVVLPRILEARSGMALRHLRIWSAGCSTGEEPYTLAMVLSEHAERNIRFHFRVLATDISTVVLEQAERAVFRSELVQPVPAELRRRYLLRSKDPQNRLYRVVPELRRMVEFRRLNLMDSNFGIEEPVDVIFCRNVIIYFDPPTRARLLQRFTRQLRPGGYLFLGHSETLHGLDVPLIPSGPTVYRKPHDAGG